MNFRTVVSAAWIFAMGCAGQVGGTDEASDEAALQTAIEAQPAQIGPTLPGGAPVIIGSVPSLSANVARDKPECASGFAEPVCVPRTDGTQRAACHDLVTGLIDDTKPKCSSGIAASCASGAPTPKCNAVEEHLVVEESEGHGVDGSTFSVARFQICDVANLDTCGLAWRDLEVGTAYVVGSSSPPLFAGIFDEERSCTEYSYALRARLENAEGAAHPKASPWSAASPVHIHADCHVD